LAQDWCAITNRTRYWFQRRSVAGSLDTVESQA
jgi:hypothetical protein